MKNDLHQTEERIIIPEYFNLSNDYLKKYWEVYHDKILEFAKREFFRLRKQEEGTYPFDGDVRPDPDVIGRILGTLYKADDGLALVVACYIFFDYSKREKLYVDLWKGYKGF